MSGILYPPGVSKAYVDEKIQASRQLVLGISQGIVIASPAAYQDQDGPTFKLGVSGIVQFDLPLCYQDRVSNLFLTLHRIGNPSLGDITVDLYKQATGSSPVLLSTKTETGNGVDGDMFSAFAYGTPNPMPFDVEFETNYYVRATGPGTVPGGSGWFVRWVQVEYARTA